MTILTSGQDILKESTWDPISNVGVSFTYKNSCVSSHISNTFKKENETIPTLQEQINTGN